MAGNGPDSFKGWAAFINTESSNGISDLSLLGIMMGFFTVGASIGFLDLGKTTGIALLGVLGGLSIGIRTVIFRSGLLVGPFFINWIIVAVAGIAGGILVLLMRRIGIVSYFTLSIQLLAITYKPITKLIGSAATGTFLASLGIDLILNKQSGMSRGLRTLFDQNTSHIAVSSVSIFKTRKKFNEAIIVHFRTFSQTPIIRQLLR